MTDHQSPDEQNGPMTIPLWGIVGGLALLAATAIAAPFYGHVVAGLMWAGETLRALCGW